MTAKNIIKYKWLISLSFIIYHLSFSECAVAQVKDRSGVKDVNQVVDNTPDSIAKAMTARPVPGSSRKGTNPVLFLIGNSTMRTGTLGNGNNGQWGWGYYAHEYLTKGVPVPASLVWATTR